MAKKFGKLLLVSAAIGSAIGAVYYFARKKDAERGSAEDDYDDFSEEDEKEKDSDSRGYVPLSPEGQAGEEKESAAPAQEESPAASNYAAQDTSDASAGQDGFTPLAEQVADTAQKAEESVEEFFDEEDSTDEEPPIGDN